MTDSAASLPQPLADELGIEVVPLYLSVDGRTVQDGPDAGEFYQRVAAGATVSTSTPAPGDFLEAFDRTGAAEIVCVTIAASVSGVSRSATVAAGMSPARVEVVDSGNASMAQGFVAMEAARARSSGASLDAVVARAHAVADRAALIAAIDRFEHLARSGRVSRLTSYAGTMLDIKPVFRLARGRIDAVARPRTRRRALERVASEAERAIAGSPVHLAAVHAAAEEDARRLLEDVSARCDVVEAHVAVFTPAMGAHTGPGVVGLAWFCDEGPKG